MKYKNIIFDYGNVIGRFDGAYIMRQFCSSREDYDLLISVLYSNWPDLDRGAIDYDENIERAVSALPSRLEDTVRKFFREWPGYIRPIRGTHEFIETLYRKRIPMYLLSNAPTYFAEYVSGSDVLGRFSGIVFSAPLKMAKPDPAIYRYLFDTYGLDPRECFFIDDLERNIEAGRSLGMDGMIFDGSIEKVKAAIGL